MDWHGVIASLWTALLTKTEKNTFPHLNDVLAKLSPGLNVFQGKVNTKFLKLVIFKIFLSQNQQKNNNLPILFSVFFYQQTLPWMLMREQGFPEDKTVLFRVLLSLVVVVTQIFDPLHN